MAEVELVSREEQDYIQTYLSKLKSLQEKNKDYIVYTKIPVNYAILNKFSLEKIVFHPKSIVYDTEQVISNFEIIKNTIQEIIEDELYAEQPVLSQKQLLNLIEHFKTL